MSAQNEELLKVGGGVHHHRFAMNGSVFKLNHTRDVLPETARICFVRDTDGGWIEISQRGSLTGSVDANV